MGEESPGPEDTSDNAEAWRASHPALWTRLKVKVCWEGKKMMHYLTKSSRPLCRWREAVCLMMILSEPNITPEAIAHLGRQMALLFRQVVYCQNPFELSRRSILNPALRSFHTQSIPSTVIALHLSATSIYR